MAEQTHSLRAQTRVIVDPVGRGSSRRALRRAFLVERESGLILEAQTAFVDHEFGVAALNTQLAVLADLAFLWEWSSLRVKGDQRWLTPEARISKGQVALNPAEIRDLARWCQFKVEVLAKCTASNRSTVAKLPLSEVVSPAFRMRRLRYISRYLQWLTCSVAPLEGQGDDSVIATEQRRRQLEHNFSKQFVGAAKYSPPRSLEPSESQTLATLLAERELFPPTAVGTRDRLILELLRQGIRAGELLKIQVVDVDDAYEIDFGRRVGVIRIERRPNDVDDTRVHEPAVKTRPGELAIPVRIAKELIDYAIGWRDEAMASRTDGVETPYLFVNHCGPHVGDALSQRNLNRLVAKLKGIAGLPGGLVPHVLRHTHFTELYDLARNKGRSDQQIRDVLLQRGRWAPDSTMPAHYTARSLMRESADFVEERDRRLGGQ